MQHDSDPESPAGVIATSPAAAGAPEGTVMNSPREQRLAASTVYLAGLVIAIFSMVAGFIYGDSYGRRHAQFDNPELRQYYAGQCYKYWETQFRHTVRTSLDRVDEIKLQTSRIEEIRSLVQDMKNDMANTIRPAAAMRRKVVSSASE